MHVDRYGSLFLWLAAGMLLLFAGALVIGSSGLGIALPGVSDAIEADEIVGAPELRETGENRYEAYIVISEDGYTPGDLEVPEGAEVTFFVTSEDAIYGFLVANTTLNMTVIPGEVSEMTYTFNRAGDYEFICSGYCDGHQGQITVEED